MHFKYKESSLFLFFQPHTKIYVFTCAQYKYIYILIYAHMIAIEYNMHIYKYKHIHKYIHIYSFIININSLRTRFFILFRNNINIHM